MPKFRPHHLLLSALLVGTPAAAQQSVAPGSESDPAATAPVEVQDRVIIPAFRTAPEQPARFFAAAGPAPLVIDLHYWSSDERGTTGTNGTALDLEVRKAGWTYMRPRLMGPNKTPGACCSQQVLDAIAAAIAYARTHAKVTSVHIVGGSGGGYTALCAALKGQLEGVDDYQAWVPISDLAAWYDQHAGDHYAQDVCNCTGSANGTLDRTEAARRSPLSMPVPPRHPPIRIFAGIHDGAAVGKNTSILISHSVRMYNRLAHAPVSDATLLSMLEHRRGPQTGSGRRLADREVHLHVASNNAELTIFEGRHEVFANEMVAIIRRDLAARKAAGRRRTTTSRRMQ